MCGLLRVGFAVGRFCVLHERLFFFDCMRVETQTACKCGSCFDILSQISIRCVIEFACGFYIETTTVCKRGSFSTLYGKFQFDASSNLCADFVSEFNDFVT